MNILVLSAHPDDETLGCGASLLKHARSGDKIQWALATQAWSPRWPQALVKTKIRESEKVARAYGFSRVHRLGFPAARMDEVPESVLMEALREVFQSGRFARVYLPWPHDVHGDHQALSRAAMAVLKPFHASRLGVRQILAYETPSSTEQAPHTRPAFRPNLFQDVSATLRRKLAILKMYKSEIQGRWMPRHPDAVEALARVRGASLGVRYAEAFQLLWQKEGR